MITRQNQKILVLLISLGKQPKFRNATTLQRHFHSLFMVSLKACNLIFQQHQTSISYHRKTFPRKELLVGSTIPIALSRPPREESEGGGQEERGLISLSAADNQA